MDDDVLDDLVHQASVSIAQRRSATFSNCSASMPRWLASFTSCLGLSLDIPVARRNSLKVALLPGCQLAEPVGDERAEVRDYGIYGVEGSADRFGHR